MISLSPGEVEHRFSMLGIPNRFSPAENQELITTAIVDCPDPILAFPIPGANTGLNLLNLRAIRGTDPAHLPSFFDHPWYLDESFASVECEPGWHYLYMDVLPETISQPLDYARSLAPGSLYLATAVEVTLMLFLHYMGTREQLLLKKHTWCSDQASLNRHVTVGAFGRNGLFISGHPPEFASRGLGICPKLMRARE
jgi:hypothetical protein